MVVAVVAVVALLLLPSPWVLLLLLAFVVFGLCLVWSLVCVNAAAEQFTTKT